jgi:hypothetical protein
MIINYNRSKKLDFTSISTLLSYRIIKNKMIKDATDPTKNGLFSKCARNHASKTKPNYRPVTHHVPVTQTPTLHRKKTKGRAGFDAHMSREQR